MRTLLIVSALTLTSGAARAQSPPLTFADALRIAAAQSLDAKRAALAIDLAAVDRALVDYEDDARVNVFGTLSVRYGELSAGAASSSAGSTRAAATPDLYNQLALAKSKLSFSKSQAYGTQLSRTLYDFGRHDARVGQADAAQAVKELQANEVTEALRFKVARAYAGVAGLERLAKLAFDQLKVSEDKLSEQRRNYQRGLRPESDVVTAEVEAGRARIARDKALTDVRAARLALAQTLGMALDLDKLTLAPGAYAVRDPRALAQIVQTWQAQQKSAAMARREKERQALDADLSLVDANKRPTVSGALTAQEGAPLANQPDFKPLVTGSVGISWDVPWNGMSRDEVRRVAIRRQDLDVQEAAELRQRTDKDAAAREALTVGAEQWDALGRQLGLLERQRKMVQSRYELGKASALELGQSEADLVSMRADVTRLGNTLLAATLDVAEAHAVADLDALFR